MPLHALDEQFDAPKLEFVIDSADHDTTATTSNARKGTLNFSRRTVASDEAVTPRLDDGLQGRSTKSVSVPNLIAYTKRGAVPHLTRDNVARLPTEMVHISLEHLMDRDQAPFTDAPFTLHRFLGFNATKTAPKAQLVTMGLRDATDETSLPPASDECAVACTLRGAVRVSPNDFLNLTLPRPPDILFAPGDESNEQLSSKKLERSIRRSLNWVEQVAAGAGKRTSVFAPLVGGDNVPARTEFAKALTGIASSRASAHVERDSSEPALDESIDGYVVTVPECVPEIDKVASLLNASFAPLPRTKPRVAQLVRGPHAILRLVRDCGIDLFVEEWSNYCATIGVGLDFEFPVGNEPDDTSGPSRVTASGKLDIGHSFFDERYLTSFTNLSSSPLALYPSRHDETGPAPPTRAYIHHLLHAHEMSASVILAMHNQLVMQQFFEQIRTLIDKRDGSFENQVDKFFEVYDEGIMSGKRAGVYDCVERAQRAWLKVEKERGKGSLKDKLRQDFDQVANGGTKEASLSTLARSGDGEVKLANHAANIEGANTPTQDREQMALDESRLRAPFEAAS
ncbi:hypothetical protein ACM66B_005887 [Microbotryomycetes sp. NB124-2]